MLDESRDTITPDQERPLPPSPKTADELLSQDRNYFRTLADTLAPEDTRSIEYQDWLGGAALKTVDEVDALLRSNPFAADSGTKAELQRRRSEAAQAYSKAQVAKTKRDLLAKDRQFAEESGAWMRAAEEERKKRQEEHPDRWGR